MRRREFIALLGGAVAARPLDALASVGHPSAIERTAHFFMELVERLNLVGLATETEFKCALSQYVLQDSCTPDLDVHSLLPDVASRADRHIEL